YQILREIGRGGMGTVYVARDTRLDRLVALKFLSPHLRAAPEARERFAVEARAASALDHPHIATLYEIGEADDGRLFIAMAYHDGETVKERLARGPIPVRDALEIAIQMADALAAAHRKGIIHRDVKPANVLIAEEGGVKLVDFGLAKMAGVELTRQGRLMGSAAYMSPEQARGDPVDAGTDCWAVGAVLYEMLTGRRPFRGDSEPAVLHSILHTDPEPLDTLCPDAPAAVVRVVERALNRDPSRRYQDAGELLIDLRMAAEGANDDANDKRIERGRRPGRRASGPGRVGPSRGGRGSGRGRLTAGIGGLLVALLVTAGVFLAGRESPSFHSIAVLPLDNLSGDSTQQYLAQGMTEALIAELAQVKALRVISHTSVMQYASPRGSLPEIARALGVEAVIEGSVTRAGDRVRISVQLIDAATDHHRWASSYERDLGDVLALQREVARAITRAIEIEVTPQEEERLEAARPVAPEAVEAYLRGRYAWNRRTEEGLRQSIAYFNETLAVDPAYAPAWVGLAEAHGLLAWYAGVHPGDAFPRSRAAALRALEIDPGLAAAYVPLARARWQHDWDLSGAEEAFRNAVALNPNHAGAHHGYGEFLAHTGRAAQGVARLERALALDPLSLATMMDLGSAFLFSGQHDRAVEQYRRVLELEPNFAVAYVFLGIALELMGEYPDAVRVQERAIELGGRNPLWLAMLGRTHAVAGDRETALRIAGELEAMPEQRFVPAFGLALIHEGLGNADAAMAWLERAYETRDPMMIYLDVTPQLDRLRSDPRFEELLRRTGLD
ncbi:MAG TPA: protein kinase, partial [Longimicrobiales bacterium]|nr:protein kinase [Longimicrobiales bacterium]